MGPRSRPGGKEVLLEGPGQLHELGRASNLRSGAGEVGGWCSSGSISSSFLFLWLSGAHRTGASAFVVLEAPSLSGAMREIVAGVPSEPVFLGVSSYRRRAGSCTTGELRGGVGQQLSCVGGRGVRKEEKCPWGRLVLEEGRRGAAGSAARPVPSACCAVVRGVGRVLRAGPWEGASPPRACCRFRNRLLGQWQGLSERAATEFSLGCLILSSLSPVFLLF